MERIRTVLNPDALFFTGNERRGHADKDDL